MTLLMSVLLVGMVALMGVFLCATPWLMVHRECFAVTVPAEAWGDPVLAGYRRSYAVWCGVASAVGLVLAVLACVWGLGAGDSGLGAGAAELAATTSSAAAGAAGSGAAAGVAGTSVGNPGLFCALYLPAMLLPMATSFGLMLHFRSRTEALKTQRGWHASVQRRVAVVDEADVPQPLSPAWSLVYLPLVGLAAWAMVAGYARIPAQVVLQVNLDGTPATVVDKSPWVAAFPVLFMAFMAIVFAVSQWGIAGSKRPVDPGAPVASAYAYGVYARAMSVTMLVMGVLLVGVLGGCMVLQVLDYVTLMQLVPVVLGIVGVCLVGAFGVPFVYGQNGSRVFRELAGADQAPTLLADDDPSWKLGVFYVNPRDPALWVPKRFGVGWTVNLGRPAAWGLLAGLVALVVALIWATAQL